MNKKLIYIVLSCVLLIVINSCKGKKGIAKTNEEKPVVPAKPTGKDVLLKSIEQQQNTFSYYTSTGEINYKDESQRQELGVSIVMEKDQYILLNVTALLGITVARVLATPDSLVILDMLHRKAIIAKYDYVKKMTGADLRLANLQNILIGNTLFANTAQSCTVDSTTNSIQILQALTATIFQKTLYTPNLKVAQSAINEPSKKQEMTIHYLQVHSNESNLFPSKFTVNISAEKKMEATFELSNFVFEKKKEIQFSIPKSYERVRL